MATTTNASSYSNWDFNNFHVQTDLVAGQFINAESTLIGAGPPTMDFNAEGSTDTTFGGDMVFPIGLLETYGIQQSRQLQRIFEIGSSRSYFIPGRTIGSVNLGRTFYNGPSILRVLYAAYSDNGGTAFKSLFSNDATKAPAGEYGPKRLPGSDDFFIDLASDLFAQPIGLATYFKDAQHGTYGAYYLEQSYVQGHQLTVSSGSVLVMEGASLQYDLLVPIDMAKAV